MTAYLNSLHIFEFNSVGGVAAFLVGTGNFLLLTTRLDLFTEIQILSATSGLILNLSTFIKIRQMCEYVERALAKKKTFCSITLMALLKKVRRSFLGV